MPDFTDTLAALRERWKSCQGCELGQYRMASGGQFVFGEGPVRGLMFIGEGPGKDEDVEGRPFVGKSGQLLRMVLDQCKVTPYSYISNTVCCRSCGQAFDLEGNPRFRYNNRTQDREPVINDQPPSKIAIQTCLPRLHEEIYLVDPLLIVTLGGTASETLLGHSVTMMSENGRLHVAEIPGAGFDAVLTEKRRQWYRKLKGEYIMPVVQNKVLYQTIPIFHPAWVWRYKDDKRFKNPVESFVRAMKKATDIYVRLIYDVYGERMDNADISDKDISQLRQGLQNG